MCIEEGIDIERKERRKRREDEDEERRLYRKNFPGF
jgi:hypothetical protein